MTNINALTSPEWEEFAPGTQRLRVPGGWIFRIQINHGLPCAVFVPDPPVPLFQAGPIPSTGFDFGIPVSQTIAWPVPK
jgi:hypothetical protein